MKKIRVLSLLLLGVLSFSLLSCQGEKGEKGDQGEQGIQGETGPKGDKGDPGEDGIDGEDGDNWLSGSTKPTDTLGKLGDMYLNTSNGDVYQKEESGWTLKMNIKGEDGEDGKDGHNGSNGSRGEDGKTAYSNTILPSEYGYVIPNKGSYIVGDENVVFTFYLNEQNIDNPLVYLEVKNAKGEIVEDKKIDSDPNTFETTMTEGGFVVSLKKRVPVTTSNAVEFVDALQNLKPGENIIEIDGTVDLTYLDNNESTISTNSISTYSDIQKYNDYSNKARKKTISVKGPEGEEIDVKILSTGKVKTLKIPFLEIVGVNVKSFTINNIDIICEFDPVNRNSVGGGDVVSDFITCNGIEELKFNQVNFSLETYQYNPDEFFKLIEEYGRTALNFINFDGRVLDFNQFDETKENLDYLRAFININMFTNSNLEEINLNKATIYSTNPFRIAYSHYDDWFPLISEINIKNSTFINPHKTGVYYNVSTPFIDFEFEYMPGAFLNDGQDNIASGLFLDVNIENSIYKVELFDEFSNGGWRSFRNSLFNINVNYHVDNFNEQYYQTGKVDSIFRGELNGEEKWLLNFDDININLKNFELNGIVINSENYDNYRSKKIFHDYYECVVCELENSENKVKTYNANLADLISFWLDPNKPLFNIELIVTSDDCIRSGTRGFHRVINRMIYDTSIFPNLTLNGENIDKSTYFKDEIYDNNTYSKEEISSLITSYLGPDFFPENWEYPHFRY